MRVAGHEAARQDVNPCSIQMIPTRTNKMPTIFPSVFTIRSSELDLEKLPVSLWTGSDVKIFRFKPDYGLGVPWTATPTQVKTRLSLMAPEVTQTGCP